jgi:hypothetical protein
LNRRSPALLTEQVFTSLQELDLEPPLGQRIAGEGRIEISDRVATPVSQALNHIGQRVAPSSAAFLLLILRAVIIIPHTGQGLVIGVAIKTTGRIKAT